MPKLLVAAALAFLWMPAAVAGDTPARVVNLNDPDALERLQRSNPAHYAKVRRIVEGLSRQRDADVPRWIRTDFDARDIRYAPILLTSDPPKKHLSFALDDTRYEAVVTLVHMRGEIVPAMPR
jgi:hypothetical protein